jgi:hypothetical protein
MPTKEDMKITLEDILEWLKNDGCINDVHYDEESVIKQIEEVLAREG